MEEETVHMEASPTASGKPQPFEPPPLQFHDPGSGDASDECDDDDDADGEQYHLNIPQLQPGYDASRTGSPASPQASPPQPEPLPLDAQRFLAEERIDSDQDVQLLIRKISKDVSLSASMKTRLCQAIHSHRFQQVKQREAEQLRRNLDEKRKELSWSNVKDPETGKLMLGCEHYPRYCKLKAACCGAWVVCRQCHDRLEMGHTMDRTATREVMCMRCETVQPVSRTCVNCRKDFARYFCEKCKFYDSTPGKAIYHCDDCGICRVGRGIGVDNFHCKRCDACVSKEYAKNHKCLKKSLDANCPICGQYLFTSTKPVVFMRCGHTMHSHCFDAYTAEHYTCPLCHKALTNMTPYYRQLDQTLKRQQMPEEHRDKLTEVLCHDCDKRSITPYHFCYLKCGVCESYNTRPIRTFRKGEGSSQVASASSAERNEDTAVMAMELGEPVDMMNKEGEAVEIMDMQDDNGGMDAT